MLEAVAGTSRLQRHARALLAVAALVAPGGWSTAVAQGPSNEDCLVCHEDPELARADGTPLRMALDLFAESPHGQIGVACTDCHADLAQASDFPHAEKLAPVSCAACHEEAGTAYAAGAHAVARRAGDGLAATCSDCHGGHAIFPKSDPRSSVSHFNLQKTCARCHGNPETIEKAHIAIGNVPALFEDSIHGQAVQSKGLSVAPTCNDCHSHHLIRRARDEASPVFRGNIPSTCGKCHAGIVAPYEQSVHGRAVRQGNPRAAVCTDCHSAHGIKATGPDWRVAVIRECGTCHKQSIQSYRDGFHGQVTALGFTLVATCEDCHGAHDIAPIADARSAVSQERRVATCGKCHDSANARFVQYDPHAEPENPERSAILYYTNTFMKLLLGGVFVFFGLHTALWLPRSWQERRKARAQHGTH
jgi:hypothetical protein